ncbi:MAG TPA: ROK family protein [Planctomycetota bacterium]|nr:ROK family protein [Planctomycetota bacterium]
MSPHALVACHPLHATTMHTLAIDIGGTGLKASVVDPKGNLVVDRLREDTPVGSHPDAFVEKLAAMVAPLPSYDRIAVGFPGMVRAGVVRTAPHLGHDAWAGYPLAAALERRLGKPVRLGNDADVQGLAVVQGKGMEMVITLGTGVGTSLYIDGKLCPHIELGHSPFRKGESYDQQLGEAARKQVGTCKWQKRVQKAIVDFRRLTMFDHLYIGGGNARRIDFELPPDITLVDNNAGISGGAFLWRDG